MDPATARDCATDLQDAAFEAFIRRLVRARLEQTRLEVLGHAIAPAPVREQNLYNPQPDSTRNFRKRPLFL